MEWYRGGTNRATLCHSCPFGRPNWGNCPSPWPFASVSQWDILLSMENHSVWFLKQCSTDLTLQWELDIHNQQAQCRGSTSRPTGCQKCNCYLLLHHPLPALGYSETSVAIFTQSPWRYPQKPFWSDHDHFETIHGHFEAASRPKAPIVAILKLSAADIPLSIPLTP